MSVSLGRWFVWEPEWSEGYKSVERLIIARTVPNDCPQEIAYVNCTSGFFPTKETVPVKSEFRNDATANIQAVQNAHLIAASKDLYAALVTVREKLNAGAKLSSREMALVDRALRKAEGKK